MCVGKQILQKGTIPTEHNLRRNNIDYVQISFVFGSGQVIPMNSKYQPTKVKRLPFMQIIYIYGMKYGNLSYIS
jgi:hypothetical protein